MSKISTYEVAPVPKLSDKLIGTSVGGEIEDITYNFTLQELLEVFLPVIPANNLQGILDYGNTATQDINLFGTITTTNLNVTGDTTFENSYFEGDTHIQGGLFDGNDSIGTAGQVLTSTGDGVEWFTLPPIFTPNLQQVLEEGNTADLDIILDADLEAINIVADTANIATQLSIQGVVVDYNESSGSSGQVLESTVTGVQWTNLPVYSATSPLLFNSSTGVFSIQVANSTQNGYLSSSDWITFNGKQNAGSYITALTGEATATGPGSVPITLNNASVINKVLTGLNITGGNVVATDSILTAFGKVQNQINGLVGGVQYQGVWDAATNTPTLTSSVGTQGYYYIVSVAGTTNLNGITDWQIGDWAIFSGGVWQKVDNTDSVTSVNGQTGAVSLTTDNIPEGVTNLYFLDSRARAAVSATSPLSYNNTTGVFSIQQASGTQNGYLSSTDWTTFNSKQDYLNGTGLVKSTAGTITYITDNSGNWNTAYNDSIVSAAVTGTGTKTLTLNQQDGGTIQASWTDADTGLTSVGLTMPSAFSVANSPLTSNGTIGVTGAGTTAQYIRGDGSLATFPSIISEAQNLVTEVYNSSGATLTKGTVVYINGGQGNLPTITKAIATGDATSAQTYGVVRTDITNMNNGYVVVAGRLGDLDTQAYTPGQQLYLSSTTAGLWTPTKQYAPNHLVYIAIVVRAHPTQGVVEVMIQNGYEMDELHNVAAQNPDNNDILQYKTSTNLWTKVAGTTTNIAEGTNLYYLDSRARAALSLTTTGSSGAATYNSTTGVFNIPNYGNALTAYVPYTGATANVNLGTNDLLSRSVYIEGIASFQAGLLMKQFSGYNFVTGDYTQIVPNLTTELNIVHNQSGGARRRYSLSVATLLDGDSFQYTVPRQSGMIALTSDLTGFLTAVTASSPLFSSGGTTPNITIQQASGSQNGFLSSTDWTTFNNKQAAGNYITSLTGEATASGPGAAAVTLNNASVTAKVLTGVNITGGSISATDSILTAFGKVQNQINGLIGSTIYQGTWNASTNTPALASGVGVRGYYYIVSVAGTTNLDGITDWFVGDWAIFDGTAWQQVDNTDAVVSVNGQTGAVSLTTDNIPEGATNQYFLNSRARAALSFTAGSGAYNSTTGVITIPTNTSQLTNGANFITLASLSGTAPIQYNNTTGAISITQAGTASNGFLSSTDWNTFNNKQSALTNPVTGTGTTNYLPKFTGTSTIGNSQIFDNGTNVGIGTINPTAATINRETLVIRGTSSELILQSSNATDGTSQGFGLVAAGNDAYFVNRLDGFYSWITGGSGNTERMRLDASGNLGLGITSPLARLHILGDAYPLIIASNSATTLYTIYKYNTTTDVGYIGNGVGAITGGAASDFGIAAATGNLLFASGGVTERMRIDASGRLLVNRTASTNSSYYLQVTQGISSSTSVVAQGTLTGYSGAGLFMSYESYGGRLESYDYSTSAWKNIAIAPNGGNVGIGTTSPAYKLQIGNASSGFTSVATIASSGAGTSVTNLLLQNTNASETVGTGVNLNFSGVANWLGRINAQFVGSTFAGNANMSFWTPSGGSLFQRMTLDFSGNLGLGVTPSAWAAGRSISVGNSAAFYGDGINYIWSAGIAENAYKDATVWKYVASGYSALRYEQLGDNGSHAWYIAPSGTAGNAITFTQAMTLDASGRLGIGVTSPTTFLDINSGTNPPIIKLTSSAVGQIPFSIRANIPGFSNSGFSIYDETAAASRLVISSTGNVGIGLNNPTSKLHSYSTAAYVETQGISSQSDSNIITLGAGSSGSAAFETNYMGVNESGLLSSKSMRFSIYGAGGSYFRWSNNGTPAMTLTSGGNLLVGTTSVGANGLLQINGSIGLSGNTQIRQASNGDGNTLQVFATQFVSGTSNSVSYSYTGGGLIASITAGDSALLFDSGRSTSTEGRVKVTNTTSGNTALTVEKNGVYTLFASTAGNVGIGTNAPQTGVILDIRGAGAVAGGSEGLRIGNVGDNSAYDNVKLWYTGFSGGAPRVYLTPRTTPGSGVINTYFHLQNTNGTSTASNNTMGLLVDGIVGIGTTAPATLLDVRSANISGASGATIRVGSQNHGGGGDEFANLEFYWGDPDSAEVKAKIYTKNVGNVGPGGGGAADLLFATRPAFGSLTERMRITSGGQVNINSTQTVFPFYVQAALANWATVIENSVSSSAGLLIRQTGGSAGFYYGAYDGGAYKFYINGSGVVNSTSTSITAISDITLKENIRDLETGLNEVMKLKPRRFDWKDETKLEKNVAGFIAQELQDVLPDLVYDYKYNDKETKKSIKMGDILPTLVKAIQELKAEIENLKNK